jgi:hypothetical protein
MTGAIRRRSIRVGAVIGLAIATASSGATLELGGPEIVKIGWSSGSLAAGDIDADGRTDLAIINNDRARIELLIQREPGSSENRNRPVGLERWQPVLEDARFDRRTLPTGTRMFALDLGDLNGDDLLDLIYTGTPDDLTIRFQDRDGSFGRTRTFDISEPAGLRGTVVADDINGDGRDDLVVLTKTELIVLRQGVDGELNGPESTRLPDGCYALDVRDVNGDGLPDVSYQVSGTTDSFRVRHGLRASGFGPEISYRMSPSRGVVRTIPNPGGAASDLLRIQAETGILERLTFTEPEPGQTPLTNSRARVFVYPTDGKTPAAATTADLDGNGLLDLAVADPRGARIRIMLQTDPGVFAAAEEFPSLAGIRSLVAIDRDGDGRDELLMASPKERSLAWAGLSQSGTLELPVLIPNRGRPRTAVAADFDGDGRVDLVYASVDKRDRRVYLLSGASSWTHHEELSIRDVESDPEMLGTVDLDGDGRRDLVLFLRHEGARLLVSEEDGFREIEQLHGLGQSLLSDVEPSEFSTGDVDGDGIEEMIIAEDGFARALRLDDDDGLEVVAQFNARTGEAEIDAAAVVTGVNGYRDRAIVLIETINDRLHVLSQRRTGVWRFVEGIDLPSFDVIEARSIDLDDSGTDDLALFGADRFLWIPSAVSDPVLTAISTWEGDLEGVGYQLLATGDFDDDGVFEVIAVDTRDSHVLEVLRPGTDGQWRSLLHFTVFEVDPHYEGQRGSVNQPREIVIADCTDDGLDDLILVAHDRVLLYPQIAAAVP